MRDDYKIEGAKKKVEIEIEAHVASLLESMSQHTKLTPSEISNTALKRFIAAHKDFLPARNPTASKAG
jgi:hypothetical protein